jgi:hypothetical protein
VVAESDAQRAEAMTPDAQQLDRFVRGIFTHASSGGVVSLRAFLDGESEDAFDIQPVRINGSLDPVVAKAVAVASRCATATRPAVFCPPTATFKDTGSASEGNLHEGLTLTLECDSNPSRARATLEPILGPPTFDVASGGEWVNPETGERERKRHLHYVLREPTTTTDEHDQLKRARSIACDLVGADATCKSIVHPIRWPGSVHRKGTPRLAEIIEENPDCEIDLPTALEELERVAAARGIGDSEQRDQQPAAGSDTVLDPEGLLGCAERIPNDATTPWGAWNRIGMALWRASNGSEAGFEAFDLFSQKNGEKYDEADTRGRWKHYAKHKPTKIGAGSLIYWARQTDPKFKPREFFDDAREESESAGDEHGSDEQPRAYYRVFSLSEAAALPPVTWRVDGILPERGKFCFAGPPASGKGLVAIDFMLSIATGLPLRGNIAVIQGPVLYLAAEGWPGIPQRCNAWLAAHKLTAADIPFTILPASPQLNVAGDTQRVLATIERQPVCPVAVVIDTLSRTLSGSDSEAKDMNPYLHAIDRIQNATDGLVGVLHHTGWNTARERGFSGLRGDVDTMVLLARDGLHIKVTCEKQKDAEEFEPLTYAICSEGDSVYAKPVLDREAPTEAIELTGSRRKAFDVLFAATSKGGLGFENWIGTSGLPRNTLNEARKDLVRWKFIEPKARKWCVAARFFDD